MTWYGMPGCGSFPRRSGLSSSGEPQKGILGPGAVNTEISVPSRSNQSLGGWVMVHKGLWERMETAVGSWTILWPREGCGVLGAAESLEGSQQEGDTGYTRFCV